jgi:hypothetical protein
MDLFIPAPERYPDIYPAVFSIFGAANLSLVWAYGVFKQWNFNIKAKKEIKLL